MLSPITLDQIYEEFAFTPTLRWKWFPWNDYVYTNLRFGPLGISYVTAIPTIEFKHSLNGKDSQLLNALVWEITLAPSVESKWETFLRIHHRSGIYGHVNGADSGANWVSVGLRTGF